MSELNTLNNDRAPLLMSTQADKSVIGNTYSYWQRVWLAFIRRRAGLLAFAVLLALSLFSFLGSWVFPQSPYVQNVGNRFGQASNAETVAIVENGHWQLPSGSAERLYAVEATTEFVRLRWPVVQTVGEYRIYRQEQALAGYGVLVGKTTTPWYEDRMDLVVKNYRYTVFAGDQLVGELNVLPQKVISRFYAELTGLIAVDSVQQSVRIVAHPLGTDALGRDVLARLIAGGQISLGVGFLAPLLAIIIGTILGAMAAVVGGKTDELIMRFSDIVIALPFLLFVIILNVAFGYGASSNGVLPMFWALVLMGWPNAAKLVRGQVLLLKEADYIAAARLLGASPWYLLRVHIIPQLLGVVLVALSFAVPTAIFTEALLSFIGLGVAAPAASWGSLCQEAMSQLQRYPHLLLYPACLISLTVLAFNVLGDSLRDALAEAGGKQ